MATTIAYMSGGVSSRSLIPLNLFVRPACSSSSPAHPHRRARAPDGKGTRRPVCRCSPAAVSRPSSSSFAWDCLGLPGQPTVGGKMHDASVRKRIAGGEHLDNFLGGKQMRAGHHDDGGLDQPRGGQRCEID